MIRHVTKQHRLGKLRAQSIVGDETDKFQKPSMFSSPIVQSENITRTHRKRLRQFANQRKASSSKVR